MVIHKQFILLQMGLIQNVTGLLLILLQQVLAAEEG